MDRVGRVSRTAGVERVGKVGSTKGERNRSININRIRV